MGAWGHKTFEDDSALDLIDEWIQEARPWNIWNRPFLPP